MRNVHIPGAQSDHLDWFRQGALYQIFPDRFARAQKANEPNLENWNNLPTRENYFGGNFKGIQSKIDYLNEPAIKNIYFTPIFKAPANHRYDTSDYLELEPLLGNEEEFKSLVEELKKSKVGVILDAVFNHCGEEFPPFQKALQGDESSRKWFQFDGPQNEYQTVGGAQMMPQLNTANDEVFEYFVKVMRKWDSFGIRGWRLDVPWKTETGFLVQDESGNPVDNFGSVILDKSAFFAKRGYTQEMDSRARTEKEFALFNEIVAEFLAFEDELKNAGVKVRRFGEAA